MASKFYTETQAKQMAHDTVISRNDSGLSQVHIHAAPLSESDDAFFMDYNWLEWFKDEHPEWKIVGELVDLYEVSNYLYVWMAVIEPVYAAV